MRHEFEASSTPKFSVQQTPQSISVEETRSGSSLPTTNKPRETSNAPSDFAVEAPNPHTDRPLASQRGYLTIAKPAIVIAVLAAILASLLAPRLVSRQAFSYKALAGPTPSRTASSARAFTITLSTHSNMKFTPRPSDERGHADHGWLHTFHTFSFASYYDPAHESFGPLRVINEDRVAPRTGFGTHGHAEFLIWTYVVNGQIEHKDSMGNTEYLRRGDVQFTSAGTGIRHSEHNRHPEEELHLLQIWAKPFTKGLKPSYATQNYPDAVKTNKLVKLVDSVEREGSKNDEGVADPIPLHADVTQYASILEPGHKLTHTPVTEASRTPTRKVFVQLVMSGREQPKDGQGSALKISSASGAPETTVTLKEGDSVYIDSVEKTDRIVIESVGQAKAEFILFDMANQ